MNWRKACRGRGLRYNVLQLVCSFHSGGSERQAVQLARLLHESGRYHVSVATLEQDGVLRAEVERLGLGEIPEYPLTSFYDRNALVQLRRFARYLRKHRIAIVHAHDFYTNIFGMTAAAMARVPVRIASRRESAVRSTKQRFVERCAYRLAHAVVANCEEVRQQLIGEGVRAEKVTTFYNGLDLARVTLRADLPREQVLASLNLPAEGRRFVTIVANLRAHFQHPEPVSLKDHPTLLRAAQRVRRAVPEAAFVIAGEGEMLEQTRALAAQLGLAHDVFFIGRCERVAELLAVSEVCVLSSRAEGFANSILEYMAAARPVVATDVGGAREAVLEGETGYLVAAGDDERMAAQIIALLREPERARAMGRRGKLLVEQKFSCAAQLARAQNLYDHLLGLELTARAQVVGGVRREGV